MIISDFTVSRFFGANVCILFFFPRGLSTTSNHNKHGNPMIVTTHHNPRPSRIGGCESVAISHYFRVDKKLLINVNSFHPLHEGVHLMP